MAAGARRHPRGHLPRDRRPDRPQAAGHAGGGRAGDAVPRLRPGVRGQRDHPRRRAAASSMATRTRDDLGSFDDITAAAVRTTGLERLRRHRARGGAAPALRGPRRARRADARGQLHAAHVHQERAGRPAALRARLQGAPVVRRGADRATDLRLRPPAHRHHGAAPPAQRRPGAPGARAVADRGPAAAAAARDLGRRTRSTAR